MTTEKISPLTVEPPARGMAAGLLRQEGGSTVGWTEPGENGRTVVRFRFVDSSDGVTPIDGSGSFGAAPTVEQQQAFRLVTAFVEATAGVDLVEASDGGLVIGTTSAGSTRTSLETDGSGGITRADILLAGDAGAAGSYGIGGEGFATLLAELLEALGLSLPATATEGLDPSVVDTGLTALADIDHPGTGSRDEAGAVPIVPQSPMVLDVEALRLLYGEPTGATVLDNSFEPLDGGTILATIVDNGGEDVIDAALATEAVSIDLREGSASSIGSFGAGPGESGSSAVDNIRIAFGTEIENARGGSGDDEIAGNALDNDLEGGFGADRMTGREGADIFLGTAEQLNGDTIVDFGAEDSILLMGSEISTDALSVDEATRALLIDSDGDGIHETRMTLEAGVTGTFATTVEDGHTIIRFTPDPSTPSPELMLSLGTTVTDELGNRFGTATDTDGEVMAHFEGTGRNLELSVTGYDIDFAPEVEVLVNGTSLGFLSVGENDGLNAGDVFAIPASIQLAGDNIVTFRQTLDPNFKWGVTNITLDEAPLTLEVGSVVTDELGNRFGSAADTDGEVTTSFVGTGRDLILTVDGYDVDFPPEIEVVLNGESLGFLSVGANDGLNAGDGFLIPIDRQVEGQNELAFRQTLDSNYKWGVTNILLTEIPEGTADLLLEPGDTAPGPFGNRFGDTSDTDGELVVGFVGTNETLQLSLTGYDIDFAPEVEVLLNGASLGFLSVGPNDGLNAGDSFEISADQQLEGLNLITVRQTLNASYKWGVADIHLEVVAPDMTILAVEDLLETDAELDFAATTPVEASTTPSTTPADMPTQAPATDPLETLLGSSEVV